MTWFDAVAWLNRLSEVRGLSSCYQLKNCKGAAGDGMTCDSVDVSGGSVYACDGYRLLTEFEFEYVYRAGTATAFYSGDITPIAGDSFQCLYDPKLDTIAWYCFNSGMVAHHVGQKQPNAWGFYDVAGNAFEWTHSKYNPNGYGGAPLIDPPGTDATIVYNDSPTARGGGFNAASRLLRAAARLEVPNWGRGGGFRIARTLRSDAGASDAASD